jgi:hypothetical protein
MAPCRRHRTELPPGTMTIEPVADGLSRFIPSHRQSKFSGRRKSTESTCDDTEDVGDAEPDSTDLWTAHSS